MLSLVFGTEITDASVASISQSYSKLELLDLSGYVLEQMHIKIVKSLHKFIFEIAFLTLQVDFRSSISDSGIGMICNVFPGTLSRFLLAICSNITSSNLR